MRSKIQIDINRLYWLTNGLRNAAYSIHSMSCSSLFQLPHSLFHVCSSCCHSSFLIFRASECGSPCGIAMLREFHGYRWHVDDTMDDTIWHNVIQKLCQLAEADRIFRALLEKIPLDTIVVLLAIQSVKSSVWFVFMCPLVSLWSEDCRAALIKSMVQQG